MSQTLKIGLIIDTLELPIWAIEAIVKFEASSYLTLELIITTGLSSNSQSQPKNWLAQKTDAFLNFIYGFLIERQTYLRNPLEEKNAAYLFESTDLLSVNLQRKQENYHFKSSDIDKIKHFNLDVLIHLSDQSIKGDILTAVTNGVWKVQHSDINEQRGGRPGFWESMCNAPVTGLTLRQLDNTSFGGRVIAKSYSSTNTLSIKDNRSSVIWKSPTIVARKLQELYHKGGGNFWADCKHLNPPINFYNKPYFSKPSTLFYSVLLFNKVVEKIKTILQNYFYFRQWILLFEITKCNNFELTNYKKIIPPKDRFWADPHIIHRGGKYYIYIEEVLYKNRKGHISLLEMNEDGSYNPPKKIIEHDYHMSYPHIVEYKNDYYMIPETAENETISIYKCVKFPDKWEFHMHLMENIKAYDATLLFKDNLWWLFANVVESNGISSWDELFIFSSPELLSENWCAHSKNPVISDCRSSRPAGKIFKENGRIYRPSQNSSIRYGYGLKINEIIELNQENYEERLVTEALPNWNKSIIGLHTFNSEGNLKIIDAIYKRRK